MLKEIFTISNYPYLDRNHPFMEKLVIFFKTYGILLLTVIAVAPIILLTDKFVTQVLHHKSLNNQGKDMFKQLFKHSGYFSAFAFVCLIGPVFEEMIFRFALSFKKRDMVITLLVAVLYFAGAFFHPKMILVKAGIEIFMTLIIAGLCTMLIPASLLEISDARKKQIVIASICLFGLMHISNYRPLDWSLIWIYPIFVLPQALLGWGITYVRFKNGFVWGVALHCLINTVSTLLAYFLKAGI